MSLLLNSHQVPPVTAVGGMSALPQLSGTVGGVGSVAASIHATIELSSAGMVKSFACSLIRMAAFLNGNM